MNAQTAPAVVKRIARPRSLGALVAEQVREAFLRLRTERLVEVKPRRGTFVFQYDTTGLREICELRSVLEPGALRIAIKRDHGLVVNELVAGNDAGAEAALAHHVYNGYWGLVRMLEQEQGAAAAKAEEPVGGL